MSSQSQSLTSPQQAVLQWIQDGCPDGVYTTGYGHRSVAKSLERRGLVTISGRGPTWTASICPVGEQCIEKPVPSPPAEPEVTAADQLVRRVLDAGGELELTESDDRNEIRELVEQSLKSPLRPHGKKLDLVNDFPYVYAVVLVDYFGELVEASPVRILGNIRRYQPSVKRFKQNRDTQRVSEEHIGRTVLVLQSLVQEAERRDIKVLSFDEARLLNRSNSNSKLSGAHVIFKVGDELYALNIRELPLKGGAKIEGRWKLRGTRPQWVLDRGYEFISSGKLELIVEPIGYGDTRYRDGKRKRLEEQLPEVFRRLEISRRHTAVAKQIEAKREKYKKQRHEKEANIARQKYIDAKTWEYFKELSERWQKLERHREFLERARAAMASLEPDELNQAQAFLAHAEEVIVRLDPLGHPEHLVPKIKEPSYADLQQYMPNKARFW